MHKITCAALEERGWDVCWDCGVKNSEGNMGPHLDGRKHQQRMNLTHCDICDVRTSGHRQMIQHLLGRRHQVRLRMTFDMLILVMEGGTHAVDTESGFGVCLTCWRRESLKGGREQLLPHIPNHCCLKRASLPSAVQLHRTCFVYGDGGRCLIAGEFGCRIRQPVRVRVGI